MNSNVSQDVTSHNSSSSTTALLMNEAEAMGHTVTGKNTNDNDYEHQPMGKNQTFVLPPEVWASVIECELLMFCPISFYSIICLVISFV